jgi:pimeloyl-ACP methyl ester carboxylesterase
MVNSFRLYSLIKKFSLIKFSVSLLLLTSLLQNFALSSFSYGYHQAGKQEQVVFYARRDSDSNEYIARNGIFIHQPDAQATIVLLHGYGTDKFDLAPFTLLFKKYNTFLFDFRAHGESKHEQQSTLGYDEVYDVFGAVDYLRARPGIKEKPIIAFAFSMGAATAIESQAQRKLFDAMWLDTPFSSSEDVIKQGLDALRFKVFGYEWDIPGRTYLEKNAFKPFVQTVIKWLLKFSVNFDSSYVDTMVKPISPVESIKKVQIPCFFVVCKNDAKVPMSAVTRIYENAAANYKRLWISEGRRHCDSIFHRPSIYEEMVNNFITTIITGRFKKEPASGIINV